MGCNNCGGSWILDAKQNRLICEKCGSLSLYQPMLPYEKLLEKNKQLEEKIKDLESHLKMLKDIDECNQD